MKYFAYGSNMDLVQMKERCPKHKLLGNAVLEGWEFFINSLGVASISMDQKSESNVHGLLFEISKNCLDTLDIKEGHPNAYRRIEEDVNLKGNNVKAWVYIDTRTSKTGNPRPNYLERVIQAAKSFNFPSKYITHLESFLQKGGEKIK